MKKMLVKAVALSLVMGGVGFIANDAQAAKISDGVKVFSGVNVLNGYDVKTQTELEKDTALANQKDLAAVNKDVETNKANIAANKKAIDNEVKARQEAITQERNARTVAELNLGEQITQEKNARIDADKAEAVAREDADNKLNAKIDSNAAKVQEQLDAQDKKNGAQDASIKANGAAIKANKDAIDANAAAIKANKAEADEQHKYLNSRVENNTANIDKNKVAIENEAKAREDADTKLQNNINAEATTRENAVNALNSRIDQVGSDATKGIAKASALAALHPLDYDPDNKFDIAAAGGFYKGENAFALGAFYRPNRNVMLSMGTTLTSGDNAYNVGVTFKIGKSGKHTEAGLTTADLYAMIGAMQDKMDQQQKKIEELEAKQAK